MDRITAASNALFGRARDGRLSRRDVLRAALALAALPLGAGVAAQGGPRIRFPSHPFTLGVASGYPRPDGVTLWTRLAPLPFAPDGGLPDAPIPVTWEVAADERFARVVASGTINAVADLAHAVHVDVAGLAPARPYWYRFRCGDEVSPGGRTRTAPGDAVAVERLRWAIASCQHFEHGWFAAHRQLAADDLDLMLFLGDYLYEGSWGTDAVRVHVGGEARDLAGYRQRHAQYKTDTDLQASHAAMPFAYCWDDHEVDNDYAGDLAETLDPRFLARRAAAYQAFFEHQPLPRAAWPDPRGRMRMHTTLDFGTLARIALLDERQHRDPQPCPLPPKAAGGSYRDAADCADLSAPRSLLGADQEAWFDAAMAASPARWNLIAHSTLLARLDGDPGTGTRIGTDLWDGYPAARERLLASLRRHRVANPVGLSGDLHATVIADVHRDADDPRSPVVLSEFCTPALNAQGWTPESFPGKPAANPHIHRIDVAQRGYLGFELTPSRCTVALRAVEDPTRRDAGVRTVERWVIEDGRPGIRPG